MIHFISIGVNVNSQTNVNNALGETPLHVAAEKGHFDVVKILVQNGKADVNAKSLHNRCTK